jgi:SOS-response transcriptional repressor LexA
LDSGEEAVKRISEDEEYWVFSSDNPEYEAIRVSKIDSGEFPVLGTVLYNVTKDEAVR